MHRTLALLGVVALVVAGLAGPANASDINAQGDIQFAETGLNDTGVLPDATSPDNEQAWLELQNINLNDPASLAGHSVWGCFGTSSTTPIEFVEEYGPTDEIAADGISRTVDPGFIGPRQFVWDSSASGAMDSVILDVRLFDDLAGSTPVEVAATNNNVAAGPPNSTCVAVLDGLA